MNLGSFNLNPSDPVTEVFRILAMFIPHLEESFRTQCSVIATDNNLCGCESLPPGCIIAAMNCISTILVNSPGFSRL